MAKRGHMGLDQISWKEAAIAMVPELTAAITKADTPYSLWFELWDAFKAAYNEPRNTSIIARIYKYADWSEKQQRGQTASDDLPTCVSVCFFEEIPTYGPARDDIPNWFTEEEFRTMRGVFSYHFTDAEFEKIEATLAGRTFRGPV